MKKKLKIFPFLSLLNKAKPDLLFPLLLLSLILFSCTKPVRGNPFDSNFALPAPSNFSITQTSVFSCQLTWTDNSNGEQGFRIDRKKDNEAWQVGYAEVGKNVTEFDEDEADLDVNSIYYYRIYGFADENTSSTIDGNINMNCPAPENLTYTIENLSYPTTDIHLDWDYSIIGIDGFKVNRNGTILSNIIPAGTTEWIDVSVPSGESHIYKILAFYQSFNSDYSNEVTTINPFEGMIFIQGGTFEMGDHFIEGSYDELPVHDVTLDDFFIGESEVTQAEYEAVVGSNPAWGGGDYPVYNVEWYEAVTFCNLKSQLEELTPCYNLSDWSCDFAANGYRLPTEAEWEYAARGGIYWEDNLRYSGCNEEIELPDYAWYSSNTSTQSHEVGTKFPNQVNVYDMSGNVWEWCNDWYDSSYYSSSPINNPPGPASNSNRVLRGGSWNEGASDCRVAYRKYSDPSGSYNHFGFRIVRRL
jgi:formylglycine-generating enzyme required for sulfatase activity